MHPPAISTSSPIVMDLATEKTQPWPINVLSPTLNSDSENMRPPETFILPGQAHIIPQMYLHRSGDVWDELHLEALADGDTLCSEHRKPKAGHHDSFVDFEIECLQIVNEQHDSIESSGIGS